MTCLFPPPLHPGHTVALVAPAGPCLDRDALARGIACLERGGLKVRVMPHECGVPHGYLSAPDADRLADLHDAFADPDIHAVWAVRGGYGCLRLLASIDFALLAAHPKPLIGFSDLTTLLTAVSVRCGFATFHGPMVASNLGADGDEADAQREEVLAVVNGEKQTWDLQSGLSVIAPGIAEGPLWGGNLATLMSLLGTPLFPDLQGAILFLEDIDEEPYRIDRMLAQLALAGALQGLAGVLLGTFTRCLPTNLEKPSLSLEAVLAHHVGGLGIPVLRTDAFGHGGPMPAFPLGRQVCLDGASGILRG